MVRARRDGLATSLSRYIIDSNTPHLGRNCKEPLAQQKHYCNDSRWLCLPLRLPFMGTKPQICSTTISLPSPPDEPKRPRRLRDRILLLHRLLHLDTTLLSLLPASRARQLGHCGWPHSSNLHLYIHCHSNLHLGCGQIYSSLPTLYHHRGLYIPPWRRIDDTLSG